MSLLCCIFSLLQYAAVQVLQYGVLLLHYRYYKREDARKAMCFINRTKLDDRIIRTDWDAGFVEGRQYGRGRTGGQVSFVHDDHIEIVVCLFR